jgi:hypothetical protein
MGFLSDSEAEGPSFATFAKMSAVVIMGVAPHHVNSDVKKHTDRSFAGLPHSTGCPLFARCRCVLHCRLKLASASAQGLAAGDGLIRRVAVLHGSVVSAPPTIGCRFRRAGSPSPTLS